MYYSYTKDRAPYWDEPDSGRLHDILELMRMCHGGQSEDGLFLQTIIRVCRHALEPIQERMAHAELKEFLRKQDAKSEQIPDKVGVLHQKKH